MGSGTAGAPTTAAATIPCADASTTAPSTMPKQKAKKRTIDSTSVAPLPMVKPTDYDDFLQGYLNDHPSFGYRKLLKALEVDMHVTCTRPAMEHWFRDHDPIAAEPTIADHEDFLWEQLKEEPDIGYRLMMKAILKARGVTFKETPIRAWLAARLCPPQLRPRRLQVRLWQC